MINRLIESIDQMISQIIDWYYNRIGCNTKLYRIEYKFKDDINKYTTWYTEYSKAGVKLHFRKLYDKRYFNILDIQKLD